jgi:HIRAN domain-containing protein
MALPIQRIPVVAGIAYVENLRGLPSSFMANLVPEPDNRYFRHAIAVVTGGEKVGYLAPEVAWDYFASIRERIATAPVRCPARRASPSDHATSGVELLLDFSGLDLEPAA